MTMRKTRQGREIERGRRARITSKVWREQGAIVPTIDGGRSLSEAVLSRVLIALLLPVAAARVRRVAYRN